MLAGADAGKCIDLRVARSVNGTLPPSESEWEKFELFVNLSVMVNPTLRVESFGIGEVLRVSSD
jgi:hypothetical protein